MAIVHCEIASGGVSSAAMMKIADQHVAAVLLQLLQPHDPGDHSNTTAPALRTRLRREEHRRTKSSNS